MRPNLQQIARQAGVSKMTVSLALRSRSQIPAVTRERICKIATELGYQPDPTLNLLMAHIRSKEPTKYQATLAVAGFVSPDGAFSTQSTYFTGIEQQAARRGYSVDFLHLTDPALTPDKVVKILQTRGIKGVLLWGASSPFLPPAYRRVYEQFPCVAVGIKPRSPELHFVAGDVYGYARLAFGQALKTGYHRPGMIFNSTYDQRQEKRLLAAFLAEQLVLPFGCRVPLLEATHQQDVADKFPAWYERYRPDCLISGFDGAAAVVRAAGIRIPEDVGYIVLERSVDSEGIAGVDPNNLEIGAASVDLLIGLHHRNECGVPKIQRCTVVEGTWVPGASLPNVRETRPEDDMHPSWRPGYPSLRRARASKMLPLDLHGVANRRFSTFRGYMSPLLYLEPGRHLIHGIPFQIIDEHETGTGTIALNCERETAPGEPATAKATVPVKRRAAAVYFLHTCLNVYSHQPTALYELLYKDGSRASVEVVPGGSDLPDGPRGERRRAESNVQDWWPAFPQFDNEHSRHLVITSPDEPDLYSRYLYTFEWINPHPERPIRSLQITALPDTGATLAVLAITTLEPAPVD